MDAFFCATRRFPVGLLAATLLAAWACQKTAEPTAPNAAAAISSPTSRSDVSNVAKLDLAPPPHPQPIDKTRPQPLSNTSESPPPKAGKKGLVANLPVDRMVSGTLGSLLGQTDNLQPAEQEKLLARRKAALVGTWTADLGLGQTEELTYMADGTFTRTRTGSQPVAIRGRYTVKSVAGTRGVRMQWETDQGMQSFIVTFEGNELLHPSSLPGVVGTFRKK